MINFFKTLSPLNVLWLAITLFALRACYLFNLPIRIEPALTELVARLLLNPAYRPLPPVYNVLIAGLIVFVQALLVNHLVNHFNLLGKPTFLPALMYVVLSGLFTPFLVLSPPLICNFLVIWMLFKLFSFYKNSDSKSSAFDLGLIAGFGSLVYLPFIFFFLIIWTSLVIFRPFYWREWISSVLGYATIFFFLAVYYYLSNSLGRFYNIWLPLATKFPVRLDINYYNYMVLIPVIVVLVLCFLKLRQNYYKSYVQTRKSFQVLFVFFLIALLSFYVEAAFRLNHFLLCVVPAAVFSSYYFLNARRKWFYELLFVLLLGMIVYFQFNTF